MELFVDTANLKDIEEALKRGFKGITTNPSLLSKEPKTRFGTHIGKIVDLIKRYNPKAHLSVEVFSRDQDEILKQAKDFKKNFGLVNLSIKIHIGWNELEIVNKLHKKGVSVNCTCNMSVAQGLLAATAGAEFVSFFWGRIRDGKQSPDAVVRKARFIFDSSYSKTIPLLLGQSVYQRVS